jgi:hypothetical protein
MARKPAKASKRTAKKSKNARKAPAKRASSRSSPKKKGQKKASPRARVSPGGKPARSAPGPNPYPVGTGSAPSSAEVGRQLVEMFNRGQLREVEQQLWGEGIVSVEGMGMAWRGRKAVEEKNAEWNRSHRIHGGSAEGPYGGATGFAVKFVMDVEDLASGKRSRFEEVGVYKVRNGKIVEEEFMYGPSTPIAAETAPAPF